MVVILIDTLQPSYRKLYQISAASKLWTTSRLGVLTFWSSQNTQATLKAEVCSVLRLLRMSWRRFSVKRSSMSLIGGLKRCRMSIVLMPGPRIMDNRSKRRVVRTHQYIKGIYERQKAVRRGSLPESTANSRAESPVANFRKKLGTSTPISNTMDQARTNSTVANMTNEDLVENLTDENSALITSPVAKYPTSSRTKLNTSIVGSPTNSDKNNYGSVA